MMECRKCSMKDRCIPFKQTLVGKLMERGLSKEESIRVAKQGCPFDMMLATMASALLQMPLEQLKVAAKGS